MSNSNEIHILPVDGSNWREVYTLEVNENQNDFVTDPGYYLCLCSFGETWHPLAVCRGEQTVGFLMWAMDENDNSCWLGGIIIDKTHQRKGYGRKAIELTMNQLRERLQPSGFALSYSPDNGARELYRSLGFRETGEMEDDELVARLRLSGDVQG